MHSALIPVLDLLAVLAAIVWMLRNEKDKSRAILVLALIFNLFYGTLASLGLKKESSLILWKYDPILFHLDQALGVTGISIARHLQGWSRTPLDLIYEAMVPLMACWLFITRRLKSNMELSMAYAIELVLAPILYSIVPACGPVYAFGPTWLKVSSAPLELVRLNSLPNAFPSLHTASALLLLLFAPGRKSRAVALVFLMGTMMATLATGEHYLVDLVPGLALGCLAWSGGRRQWRSVCGFAAIVLGWSLSCRFGYEVLIARPLLLRTLALCTLGVVVWALYSACAEAPEVVNAIGSQAASIASDRPAQA